MNFLTFYIMAYVCINLHIFSYRFSILKHINLYFLCAIIFVFVLLFADISPKNHIHTHIHPFLVSSNSLCLRNVLQIKSNLPKNFNLNIFIFVFAKKIPTRIYLYSYSGVKIVFVTHCPVCSVVFQGHLSLPQLFYVVFYFHVFLPHVFPVVIHDHVFLPRVFYFVFQGHVSLCSLLCFMAITVMAVMSENIQQKLVKHVSIYLIGCSIWSLRRCQH